MTVHLLDVNLLIAAVLQEHVGHVKVRRWFNENADRHWATCAMTEAGFVRVLLNQRFHPKRLDLQDAMAALNALTQLPGHQFWVMDLNFTAAAALFEGRLHGHQQVTDAYLLALAVSRKGKLVTLDRSIRALAGEYLESLLVL